MADILIKGMDMPKGCAECKLAQWDGETDVCPFCGDVRAFSERHDKCPLAEPKAHYPVWEGDFDNYG